MNPVVRTSQCFPGLISKSSYAILSTEQGISGGPLTDSKRVIADGPCDINEEKIKSDSLIGIPTRAVSWIALFFHYFSPFLEGTPDGGKRMIKF